MHSKNSYITTFSEQMNILVDKGTAFHTDDII